MEMNKIPTCDDQSQRHFKKRRNIQVRMKSFNKGTERKEKKSKTASKRTSEFEQQEMTKTEEKNINYTTPS